MQNYSLLHAVRNDGGGGNTGGIEICALAVGALRSMMFVLQYARYWNMQHHS
jgi:hypothetical protein